MRYNLKETEGKLSIGRMEKFTTYYVSLTYSILGFWNE